MPDPEPTYVSHVAADLSTLLGANPTITPSPADFNTANTSTTTSMLSLSSSAMSSVNALNEIVINVSTPQRLSGATLLRDGIVASRSNDSSSSIVSMSTVMPSSSMSLFEHLLGSSPISPGDSVADSNAITSIMGDTSTGSIAETVPASTTPTSATAASAIVNSFVSRSVAKMPNIGGSAISSDTGQRQRLVTSHVAPLLAGSIDGSYYDATESSGNRMTAAFEAPTSGAFGIGIKDWHNITTTTSANGTTTNATTIMDESGNNFVELLAALPWPDACLLAFFTLLIVVTVLGNTLVILSVITTRRLRTVTNCFVMSLAVADWLVGVFVMPPSVLLYLYGSWNVGWILCDIWISLDILLCTASILSLCAISLDRYLAVTRPLSYKKRRTKRLAMFMIFMVWILALAITCPPILGWYEPGRRQPGFVCRYNQNKGYVIFSAMGSFFIPMTVMLYVYSRICCVLASRRIRMTNTEASERNAADCIDPEHMSSDCESGVHRFSVRRAPGGFAIGQHGQPNKPTVQVQRSSQMLNSESRHTLYELVEIPAMRNATAAATIAGSSSHKASAGKPTTSTLNCCHLPKSSSKPSSDSHVSNILCESAECLALAVATGSTGGSTASRGLQRQHSTISGGGGGGGGLRLANDAKRMPIRISTSKRESKAAKTLSTVVGGFIACWLPFFVYYLLTPFLPRAYVSEVATTALTWLGWVNSAINPFIYALYNSDFRLAFWRLTFRKICKASPNRQPWH